MTMPIAKDHVKEVYETILKKIPSNSANPDPGETLWSILLGLRKVEAFKSNSSFRKTIEFLTEEGVRRGDNL